MPETLLIKTEKQFIYEQMLDLFLDKSNRDIDAHFGFDAVLGELKSIDAQLETEGKTEVHPSRYQLIKLIEKAERYI